MGILTNGPHGAVTGRVDNLVYYVLNGKNVVRKIGKCSKQPTLPQLRTREITKQSSELFQRMLDFLNVGFGIAALGTDKNAFNLAIQANKSKMFKGTYPNLEIDYSQLIVSSGFLKPGEELSSSASEEGISFNWKTDPKMAWAESTDQAMLLAYFPGQKKVVYKLFGNSRIVGNDSLVLPPSLLGRYAETYVCYISADRKQISDSLYTGSVNQPVVEDTLEVPPATEAVESKKSPVYEHIKPGKKPKDSLKITSGDDPNASPKNDSNSPPKGNQEAPPDNNPLNLST